MILGLKGSSVSEIEQNTVLYQRQVPSWRPEFCSDLQIVGGSDVAQQDRVWTTVAGSRFRVPCVCRICIPCCVDRLVSGIDRKASHSRMVKSRLNSFDQSTYCLREALDIGHEYDLGGRRAYA